MTQEFGELRSLLAQPPSEQVFDQITDVLGVEERADDDPVLSYLEGHLRRWPTDLIRRVPEDWLIFITHDIWPMPAMRLCNALRVDDFDEDDFERFLPKLPHLQTLEVQDTSLSSETLADFIPALPDLLTLRVTHCHLHAEHVVALSPGFPRLRVLDLRYTHLREGVLTYLKEDSELFVGLRVLHLQGNHLDASDLEALTSFDLRALRHLDLRHTYGSLESLANCPSLSGLEWLDIDVMHPSRAQCLGESEHLPLHIRKLWRAA